MTTLYRIHTESKPEYDANTFLILNEYFPAYNVTRNSGVWKGQAEDSLTIEVYADNSPLALQTVKDVAELIRADNNQEAVLVASFPVETHLIVGA